MICSRTSLSSCLWLILFSMLIAELQSAGMLSATEAGGNPYRAWKNGPNKSEDFFPVAVWLQAPRNAPRYKALGINVYVGLWRGPTEEQLAELKKHEMPVICSLNQYAQKHLDEPIIVGWMHGDEPDNAQSLGRGKGYGPPIPAEKIIADLKRIKSQDDSRPVLLNLGQGVAWDGWHGRGVRTNHPEDYVQYAQGGDIVSFDIYPAVHDRPAVAGKLWYVPQGVSRLRQWAGPGRVVWNCIECTRISNTKTKPTPQQVKAEVWMSLIHGSRGLIYFVHQFQPTAVEAGLLIDDEMCRGVAAINGQIRGLAPVLNSPASSIEVAVTADPAEVAADAGRVVSQKPVATLVKQHGGATYVFAVRMEGTPAKAVFQLPGWLAISQIEVLGENRTLQARDGHFEDAFGPYDVHIYKMR